MDLSLYDKLFIIIMQILIFSSFSQKNNFGLKSNKNLEKYYQ